MPYEEHAQLKREVEELRKKIDIYLVRSRALTQEIQTVQIFLNMEDWGLIWLLTEGEEWISARLDKTQ